LSVLTFRKTPAAARELNTTYHKLIGLIRFGKIEPPGKDSSGDYVWNEGDLTRAHEALEAVRRKHGAGAEVVAAE
jgi:hypothetical protein